MLVLPADVFHAHRGGRGSGFGGDRLNCSAVELDCELSDRWARLELLTDL